jgi:signal transduction histidine kinase
MTRTWAVQRLFIPLFGAFLVLLLWMTVVAQDKRSVQITESVLRNELINYARLLDSHTRSVILGLDQVATHMKAEFEDGPARFDLRTQVSRSPILKGLTVQVGIIDSDGFLMDSTATVSRPAARRIFLGDREHFRVHVKEDTGRLFISKPVLGRASGKWSIQLTRRLNAKDGTFGGVVVVSLNPDYITDIYRKIDLDTNSALIVVGRDGVQRARASGEDRTPGQSIADASYFNELWGKPEGFLTGSVASDGIPHIAAFRQIEGLPLAVIVSEPLSTIDQRRQHDHDLYFTTGFVGTGLIVLGTALLMYLALRQQRVEYDLRQRESELLLARNDLERKNRDLEQFTEVLAHHLQEPVRLQMAFATRLQKLLEGQLTEESTRALDHVIGGANRLRALLRDVQLYLAIGMLPTAAHACDSEAALEAALVRLNIAIKHSGAAIKRRRLPKAVIAQERLTDIFSALIENALTHHAPDSPPSIEIAAATHGNTHTFTITDTGIGIPEEFRERVFRVFERLNPESGRPGTGIGLPLVKRIVESAHGRVWIEAPREGGTRVCFTLPAKTE